MRSIALSLASALHHRYFKTLGIEESKTRAAIDRVFEFGSPFVFRNTDAPRLPKGFTSDHPKNFHATAVF
jgi:hypothetical protein